MDERARIRMNDDEVDAFLREGRKLQLATINPDGTPHLVTMYYALLDGRVAFWTYRAAQKARNLDRDPRTTCLVEAGDGYFDLRGVQITGLARRIDDLADVAEVGRAISHQLPDRGPGRSTEEYVQRAARKRVAYVVEPTRVVSWDHRKLAGAPQAAP
ncbi:MAG: pyridoxamine 5'-phosphate oxidase [Streptosporangiales bacterium]|nr:pyridoxamine 5'-phosphate oxidase [Streptosporangiales bacterium]